MEAPEASAPDQAPSAPSVSKMDLRTSKPSPRVRREPKQPRAKRRPPVNQENTGQGQSFFFVDPGSSTREKRAHVMRHHIQEKRKQNKGATSTDQQDGRPGRYLPWRKKQNKEEKDRSSSSAPETSLLSPELQPVQEPTPRPQDALSSARRDPFDSFPLFLEPDDYQLTDLWTSKLAYWSGQNLHMKNAVFRAAMGHPVAFQAVILCYCARWRSRLCGLTHDPAVESRVNMAEKATNDAIGGVIGMDEDYLAMALTGLSLQEQRFGEKRRAEQFADNAAQIIRSRTGTSRLVDVLLHFVRSVSARSDAAIDADGTRWLVTYLRNAERIMADQSREEFLSLVPERRDAFQFESPLYPLLAAGPRPTQVPLDHRIYVMQSIPTQDMCRTAALIYITTALWDFRHSPSRTARFLEQTMFHVKERGLDRYPACESFLWLLLEEVYDPDLKDPERAWSTVRLLNMHKVLSPSVQFHFSELLMSFLMLNKPLRGIDAFEEELLRPVP
ncbi:hypothetical protein DTO166G4_2322 [Paecilomyces variotii]|nr:hypothetical protein DTO166G4_2322 [Paecilomyces variotii]KAJ9240725.1 hypothetical protein DTO166G5_1534 [Paecilomyces variotii]